MISTHSQTVKSAIGVLTLWLCASIASAAIIAKEDFDGGAINLISSSVPTLDGGPGDSHAVGATQAWPTAGGTPFSITDNSVADVGDTMAFAGDTEGIFGQNSDVANRFLGISDSDEFGDVVSTWTFDISGATDLGISIDMGSMEGSQFAYSLATKLTFTASIDGGTPQIVFDVVADPNAANYAYRALDDGVVISNEPNPLVASGANPVTKILADTGLAAANTVLDKTPATGAAAGKLDSFVTSLDGTGSELVLTLTSNIPFEAVAIDNITVTGVPEPSSVVLALAIGSVALLRRWR